MILKAEQGVFPTLPPNILKSVAALTGIHPDTIEATYEEWARKELRKVALPPAVFPKNYKLFPEWRKYACDMNDVPNSISSFCGLFKIHPYVIQKWEAGKLKEPPRQLLDRIEFIKATLRS